jgi:hypothetical protein
VVRRAPRLEAPDPVLPPTTSASPRAQPRDPDTPTCASQAPGLRIANAPGSPPLARPARTTSTQDRRRHGGGSPVGPAADAAGAARLSYSLFGNAPGSPLQARPARTAAAHDRRRHGGGSPVGLARRRGDGSPARPAREPLDLALNLCSLDNSDSDPRSLDYADSSLAPSPWTPNILDSDHGIESYPTNTAVAPATGPSANPSRAEGALEPVA